MILPQNRHFGVVLSGLHVTGLQFRGYFFDLAKPSVGKQCALAESTFCAITVLPLEAPEVTEVSIIERCRS